MSARPFIRLHPEDNLAVAARSVPVGVSIGVDSSSDLRTAETIEMGHKVALRPIAQGQPIRKFGQTIGYARHDIPAGGWIHTHNVDAGMLSLDYAFCSEIPPGTNADHGPDVPRLSPPRWPRRDAELHRDCQYGQLLGPYVKNCGAEVR